MEDIRHSQELRALNDMLSNQCISMMMEVMNKTYARFTSVARVTQRDFLVTKQSNPRIYGLYKNAAQRLKVYRDIPLYIDLDYKIKSETIGTDEDCIIVISSSCAEELNDRQLLALLGYELGHIKFGHVKYRNIFNIIDDLGYYLPNIATAAIDAAKYLFLTWRQYADFTADRAAAVACESAEGAAERLLLGMGADLQNPDFCFTSKNPLADDIKPVNELNTVEKLVFQTTVEGVNVPLGIIRIDALREWCGSKQCKRMYPYIFYGNIDTESGSDLYTKAVEDLNSGNTERGLARLHKAADNMDTKALYLLGESYLYGKNGLPANMEFGLKCLMNAACEYNDNAQFLLAACYAKGIEGYIKRDDDKAILFARCAAGLNNKGAENLLKDYFKINTDGVRNNETWKKVLAGFAEEAKSCEYIINRKMPAEGLNAECCGDFNRILKYLLISRFDTVYGADIVFNDDNEIKYASAATTSGVYFRTGGSLPCYAEWKKLSAGGTLQEENGYVFLIYAGKPVCRCKVQNLEKSMIFLINKFMKGGK